MNKDGSTQPVIFEGKKVFAVYGFCNIRQFDETTEMLEGDIMQFVNKIASIVHNTVDEFCGNPNKNIGEAFLTVWKFPESEILGDRKHPKLTESQTVSCISDMALMCFIKIIARIHKQPELKF